MHLTCNNINDSQIRSWLEFTGQIWSPYTNRNIIRLEHIGNGEPGTGNRVFMTATLMTVTLIDVVMISLF